MEINKTQAKEQELDIQGLREVQKCCPKLHLTKVSNI